MLIPSTGKPPKTLKPLTEERKPINEIEVIFALSGKSKKKKAANKNEVKIDLKHVVLISGLGIINPKFKPNAIEEPLFKDNHGVKQISYYKINKAVFDRRFIKRVK